MLIKIQTKFAKGKEKFVEKPMVQPFATAIIDPPWPYTKAPNAKVGKGLSGFVKNDEHDHGQNEYAQLSIEELSALPVGEVVGGYIMLWTVGPFLINGAASEVLDAWGFEPVSIVTWAKWNPDRGGGYGGVGYWFLGNAEFCVVAKRASWPSIRTGKSSLIVAPKKKHSIKPDDIHDICEQRFPGPYLELFGRRLRPGWTVLGDEAPGDGRDIRDSLRELLGEQGKDRGMDKAA